MAAPPPQHRQHPSGSGSALPSHPKKAPTCLARHQLQGMPSCPLPAFMCQGMLLTGGKPNVNNASSMSCVNCTPKQPPLCLGSSSPLPDFIWHLTYREDKLEFHAYFIYT